MKVIKTIGALVAFAVGVSSAWAAYPAGSSSPSQWKAKDVKLTNDVLRIEAAYEQDLEKNESVETAYGSYFKIFSVSSVDKVTAQGLPAGVKLEKIASGTDKGGWGLTGKPTKDGVYIAKITATNKNKYEYTRVIKFVVGNKDDEADLPEEFEFDEELDAELYLGLCIEGDLATVATWKDSASKESGASTFTISGLPTGLKTSVEKWTWKDGTESGTESEYEVYGACTVPGRYIVKAKLTEDGEKKNLSFPLVVQGGMSKYVEVKVGKGMEKFGSVTTKSQLVGPGKTIKLSAKAKNGYVFAGWYYDEKCDFPVIFGSRYQDIVLNKRNDYTIADQTWINDTYYDEALKADCSTLPDAFYARFIKKSVDTKIDVLVDYFEYTEDADPSTPWRDDPTTSDIRLSGQTFTVDPNKITQKPEEENNWKLAFNPVSETSEDPSADGSYAFVKSLKGVPPFFTVDKWDGAVDELWYNPTKKIVPGEYEITAAAENRSGAKTNVTFKIVVANKTSDVIDVDDKYDLYINEDEEVSVAVYDDYKLAVSGLPAGMKYNAKDGTITGKPKKAGRFTVTFTATKAGSPSDWASSTFIVHDDLEFTLAGGVYPSAAGDKEDGTFELNLAEENYFTVDSLTDYTVEIDKATLPKGVTADWKSNAKNPTMILKGKAKTAGVFEVAAKVKNFSTTTNVTFTLTVRNSTDLIDVKVLGGGTPVYTAGLENTNLVEITAKKAGYDIKVDGLPNGLKYDNYAGRIVGASSPKAAAAVTNDVVVSVSTNRTVQGYYALKVVTVYPEVKVYALNIDGKTNKTDNVTGAGFYAFGKDVKLKAKTISGNFFEGWYTNSTMAAGQEAPGDTGDEWKEKNYSYTVTTNAAGIVEVPTFYAKFCTKELDVINELGKLPEYKDGFYTNLNLFASSVHSTLKFKLVKPKGFDEEFKGFNLENFDDVSNVVSGTITLPGIYCATVSVENASCKSNFVWNLAVKNSNAFSWSGATPATVTNYVGFGIVNSFNSLIADDNNPTNGAGWAITVDGLDKIGGLSWGFDATTNNVVFSGKPARAGNYAVKFTAIRDNLPETALTTVVYVEVLPMPEWFANSTFNGYGIFNYKTANSGFISAMSVDGDGAATLQVKALDGVKQVTEVYDTINGLLPTRVVTDPAGNITQVWFEYGAAEEWEDGQTFTACVARTELYGKRWYGRTTQFEYCGNLYEDDMAKTNLFTETINLVQNVYDITPEVTNKVDLAGMSHTISPVVGVPSSELKLDFKKNGTATATFKYDINEKGKGTKGQTFVSPVVYDGAEKGKVYVLFSKKDGAGRTLIEVPVTKPKDEGKFAGSQTKLD